MKTKIIEANIGINEANKQKVADQLNRLLANEFVLYTKLRRFHWNVEGIFFKELHLLFEEQYNELATIIDEIAERIRKIGHFAIGSLQQFIEITDLIERLDDENSAKEMLIELVQDHEVIVRQIREELLPLTQKCGDDGSNDILIGFLKQHETMAWMLRASSK